MALAVSLVGTSLFDTGNASPYTWAAATPTGSAGIIVCVCNSAASAVPEPSISTPSWLSGAWTKEVSDQTLGNYGMTVWSGKTVASPGSDSITVTISGSPTGCMVIVVQASGQDATDFVLQPEILATSSSGTSETVTLNGALAAATSIHLAFLAHNSNEVQNPTGGETELDDGGHASPTRRLSAQYEVNDTASSFSWASTGSSIVVGLELKQATGATEHFGATASTYTLTSTTAGTRTRFGATASTYTLSATTAGFASHFGATASSYTLAATTAGFASHFGSSLSTYTLAITTAGAVPSTNRAFRLRRADGGATLRGNYTLRGTDVGAATHNGATASAYTLTVTTVGQRTRFGATASTYTMTFTTNGTVVAGGTPLVGRRTLLGVGV